jgi:hypothetical protein
MAVARLALDFFLRRCFVISKGYDISRSDGGWYVICILPDGGKVRPAAVLPQE